MISIAIDGPAGAGKSTIARAVASSLGYIYVDTGALYRAVGLQFVRKGVKFEESDEASNLLENITVTLKFIDGEQRVILNGEDVSGFIRTPEISMASSAVSALPPVRAFLLSTQRNIAKENNVVMDGRDIGTVVLPDSQVKIFLTASSEERARRRYEELIEKGATVTYEEVLDDLKIRDYNDSHRAIAPLVPAPDSITVDTTGNTLEKSVDLLKKIVLDELKKAE